MKKLLLAASCLMALALPAQADTIDLFSANANTTQLTLVAVPPPGNQPQNNPCIICGTNQPGQNFNFGYNNYKQGGNITDFKAFSDSTPGGVQLDNDTLGAAYAQSFLAAFLAGFQGTLALDIGIDVNTAGGQGAENLLFFAVVDVGNHNILASYLGPTPLPTNNNGTGFPDYLLTGFDIGRGDLNANSQIEFFARWNNASDGAESFFIVPRIEAVPGPIVGAGLPGLIAACVGLWGFNRSRRRRQTA